MTVALALKGCSLVELHAADAYKEQDDPIKHHYRWGPNRIRDVFLVVDRNTNQPFRDDELRDLAKAVLDGAKSPMNVLSVQQQQNVNEDPFVHDDFASSNDDDEHEEKQIIIIPSTSSGQTGETS